MVLVGSVEHLVLLGAFVRLDPLVDKVLLDQLLELLEEEHTLGIRDRQRAEWVEAWVLGISHPLRLGWDGRHQVSLLAREVEVLEDFLLTGGDLAQTLLLLIDERQGDSLLDFERLVVLFMDLNSSVMFAIEGFGEGLALDGVGTAISQLQIAVDLRVEVIEEVVK